MPTIFNFTTNYFKSKLKFIINYFMNYLIFYVLIISLFSFVFYYVKIQLNNTKFILIVRYMLLFLSSILIFYGVSLFNYLAETIITIFLIKIMLQFIPKRLVIFLFILLDKLKNKKIR
jgi:hypothetical protein